MRIKFFIEMETRLKIKNFQSQVCVCAASTNLKARLALRNKAAQKWSKQ